MGLRLRGFDEFLAQPIDLEKNGVYLSVHRQLHDWG